MTYPGVPGIPIEYECRSIPETCPPPETCQCLVSEWESDPGAAVDCEQLATGAHVVTLALP